MKRLFAFPMATMMILLACTLSSSPATMVTKTAIDLPFRAGTYTVIYLHPQDGELTVQISSRLQEATASGQRPLVEFTAEW
ncbi:MAG: hypothetical protein ABIJ39_09045 [Chloroflexota bacterium]